MHNIKDFLLAGQMELAIADMHRYQKAYKEYNGKGIVVKYKKGWYAVGEGSNRFVRPKKLREMTAVLEHRLRERRAQS